MPLLGFSIFREKIELGLKRQTIRKPRKRPIKVGDTLYVYWRIRRKDCKKIGQFKCASIYRVTWVEIKNDENIAKIDGFESAAEMKQFFARFQDTQQFDVIRW